MSATPGKEGRTVHRHFHEVHADTPEELGHKLGLLFGTVVQQQLEDARESEDWNWKVKTAAVFLEHSVAFPDYISELRSYAEAADVPFSELWALMCAAEFDGWTEKCTTVVTNRGTVIAHNEDWEDNAEDSICIVKKSLPALTILELHYYDAPLGGNAFSINSHGVVQAINSLSHAGRVGVPRNLVARWLSETQNVEASFAGLRRIRRASGYNHVLVDSDLRVADIEATATEQRLLFPRLPFVHTNHYLSPEFEDDEEAEDGDSTYFRYAQACRLLKPHMTLAELTELMSNTRDGKRNSILNRHTIARAMVDLSEELVFIWLKRESESGWVAYPLNWVKPHAAPIRRAQ